MDTTEKRQVVRAKPFQGNIPPEQEPTQHLPSKANRQASASNQPNAPSPVSQPAQNMPPSGPTGYPGYNGPDPYTQQPSYTPWQAPPPMSYQYQNNGMPPMAQVQQMQPLPPAPFMPPPANWEPPRQMRKKRRFPIWTRVALVLLLLLLVIAGSAVRYYYANFDSTLKNTVGQTINRLSGDAAPRGATNNNGNILAGKRINILLLGSDTDVKFTDAYGHSSYLAQTDIVVTIDPHTQSVGMLSIPRDTWINAPGHGMMKLDEVYRAGGVALSRYTIHQAFGIYIDYYAWVGLDGFIKVIDTVGGVDVDVTHPIIDDTYPDDIGNHGNDIYAMKRLSIAPGPQHLSGPEALEYVRSRHADLVGDFGRSIRQQQVLTQLKAKLNNPNILNKLPELANDLNGYVKTDMQLPDVLRLMNFARTLNQSKINRVTLGPPYSHPAQINGQDVVLLDCGQVQPIIARMFDLGNQATCNLQTANTATSPSLAQTEQTTPLASPTQGHTAKASISSFKNTYNNTDSPSDLHSLLDLMFFIVFESPQATKA